MNPILFKFSTSGKDKALRQIAKIFERNGAQVIDSNVDPAVTKRSGFSFRNANLTFADSQKVTLGVKETGDVFEVRINGSVVPVRQQDDPEKAIAEISTMLVKRRAAFQKSLARTKVVLPPSLRVSRKNLVAAKVEKRDALRVAVGDARQELDDLKASNAQAAQAIDQPSTSQATDVAPLAGESDGSNTQPTSQVQDATVTRKKINPAWVSYKNNILEGGEGYNPHQKYISETSPVVGPTGVKPVPPPTTARMIMGKMRTHADAVRFAKNALSGAQKESFLGQIKTAFPEFY